MSVHTKSLSRPQRLDLILPILGGVAIAAIVLVLITLLPIKWIFLAIVAILFVLPSLVVKSPAIYWLAFYLPLHVMEAGLGKSITDSFVSPSHVLDALGLPPSGNVSILILPSDLALMMLLGPWLLKILIKKERLYFPKMGYLALAYLTWATLSSFLKAPYPYLSLVELVQQYKYFFIYLYFSNNYFSNKMSLAKSGKWVIAIILGCLFLEGAYTLAAYKLNYTQHPLAIIFAASNPTLSLRADPGATFEEPGESRRAWGTFRNSSITAMYFQFVIPLAWVLGLTARTARTRFLSLALFIIGIAASYLTYSRAGFLALGCGLAACLYLLFVRRLLRKWTLLSLCYVGMILLPIVIPAAYFYMKTRPGSIWIRVPLMEKGLRMTLANPVLGVGLNNSTAVKKQFKEDAQSEHRFPIHNHYLVLASELGIPGLLFFLGFFGLAVRQAFRNSRLEDPDARALSVGILGSFIALFLHLMGDHFSSVAANSMLWLYAGFTMSLGRNVPVARGCDPPTKPGSL